MRISFPLLWIFCGFIAMAIARSKGRSGCGWFLLGIVFGPFSFAVALLPPVGSNAGSSDFGFHRWCSGGPNDGSMRASGRVKCPACGRWDVVQSTLEDGTWGDWCPHCRSSLKSMKRR